MAQNFLGCDRDQVFLLPPSVDDWLPADHFARFVIAAVEEMDVGAFYADYRADGHGRPAHDPVMMVALLVYAYARGPRSSRVIERACVEDIAFRVIAANRRPDHTRVARFRQRHETALAGLFGEVLALASAGGNPQVGEGFARQALEIARRVGDTQLELCALSQTSGRLRGCRALGRSGRPGGRGKGSPGDARFVPGEAGVSAPAAWAGEARPQRA